MSGVTALIDYLAGFVTEQRLQRMQAVLAERTRYATVVVEDIYQPHNASAVLRTCDCFGVQDVHIIENRNAYRLNPGVELGTAQWLTLHRYSGEPDNTPRAIARLRDQGYRIVATSPHANQTTLERFDIDAGPFALLFGTELDGLTDTAVSLSDEHLIIPMYGFVESFNISVSVAIALHHLTHQLRSSTVDYHLSPDDRRDLLLGWLRSTIARVEQIEARFHARSYE
ncbi:MAG: TrmH family RNA methyltransferase [Spirochaetaceae bacterium]|nr:MAG: TrmH family RNA methyltransferase [Spirochaetaceae bacterium]